MNTQNVLHESSHQIPLIGVYNGVGARGVGINKNLTTVLTNAGSDPTARRARISEFFEDNFNRLRGTFSHVEFRFPAGRKNKGLSDPRYFRTAKWQPLVNNEIWEGFRMFWSGLSEAERGRVRIALPFPESRESITDVFRYFGGDDIGIRFEDVGDRSEQLVAWCGEHLGTTFAADTIPTNNIRNPGLATDLGFTGTDQILWGGRIKIFNKWLENYSKGKGTPLPRAAPLSVLITGKDFVNGIDFMPDTIPGLSELLNMGKVAEIRCHGVSAGDVCGTLPYTDLRKLMM